MGAAEYLKGVREDNYNPSKPPQSEGKQDEPGKQDPDEPNRTSRIIILSDDEQKAFQGSKPGQELECLVRGNLEEDGHFHVMSVSPPNGAQSYGEDQMADQVAQKVNPMMQMGMQR